MAKHRFSASERFGVWHAYDGQCFWCGKPVAYTEATVDHVVPESLESKPRQLVELKENYALSEAFEINSFLNWVPCHASCNSAKGSRLYGPSPAMVALLDMVGRRAGSASEIARKAIEDREKGRILGKLESALEAKLVSREEVMALMGDIQQEPIFEGTPVGLEVVPGWTVVRDANGLATVTDGKRVGITPTAPNPHHSWQCPTCGNFGPWNGVICMSCGRMSDPWD